MREYLLSVMKDARRTMAARSVAAALSLASGYKIGTSFSATGPSSCLSLRIK